MFEKEILDSSEHGRSLEAGLVIDVTEFGDSRFGYSFASTLVPLA
jgi:hypothetical protein